MMILAQSFRYKSILKETSPFESAVFLVLAGTLVLAAVVWILFSRRREGRRHAAALLAGCIRDSRLSPREGELLRALAGREGVRQLLKSHEAYAGAVAGYLEARRSSGADAAVLEQERQVLEGAGRKIHFTDGGRFAGSLPGQGTRVRLRIADSGLFTAIITQTGRKGIRVSIPYWPFPAGVFRKRQEVVLYHQGAGKDLEMHGEVVRVRQGKPVSLLLAGHQRIMPGRHPGGEGVEMTLPVHFRRILDTALTKDEEPQLHVLQGTLAALSLFGAELLVRSGGQPGAVYRFELAREGPGRRVHWFRGRVLAVEKEGGMSRLFVLFLELPAATRGLVGRIVSPRPNPAGGNSGAAPTGHGSGTPADNRPGS